MATTTLQESDLVFDWNEEQPIDHRIELDDETLRDGLQSPSVSSPEIEEKLRILHLMVELGIDGVDLGLPAAGGAVFDDVSRLAREIVDQRLPIVPNAAARTVIADCQPIVEISQQAGVAIEVAAFIGSSPIRQLCEAWDIERLRKLTAEAVEFCTANDLPVMYVTEDTTRARPEDLKCLYTTAIEAGARRICIADTVGHATPAGAAAITRFVRGIVEQSGEDVKVDWHGHRDRDLAVANALAAARAGADRLHGTALGVGERVGNTPMDLLLVNLALMGVSERCLDVLPEYCRLVAESTGVPFPVNYPVVGGDAFRTATGVHAAAIVKAEVMGEEWLADRVYSGVPASMVGLKQKIEVGPMSGESNVIYWLEQRGYEPVPELVARIFAIAKSEAEVLSDQRLESICADFRDSGAH